MSRSSHIINELAERANERLDELDPDARPVISIHEKAELIVRCFQPLRTTILDGQLMLPGDIERIPNLSGEYRVDALETKKGTEAGTMQIAAIVPVEEGPMAKEGYAGVFLEAAMAQSVLSQVLDPSQIPILATPTR